MISSWVLFAVAAGLASNIFNFLSKYILQTEDDQNAFAWFTELVRFCFALLIVSFDSRILFNLQTVFVFLVLGIIEFLSIYTFMKMHAFSHLSVSTIISRTRLIWVPMLAFLLWGETLRVIEYIGIVILFFGLSIAVSPKKIFVDKGVAYSYASALIVAVLALVMKIANPLMSTAFIILGMTSLTVFTFPFMMKNAKKRIPATFKKHFFLKVFSTVLSLIATYLYIYALQIGNVSKVTAIYQGMMIVSVFGGIFILGEKEAIWKKSLGTVITLIGVVLLTAV